MKLRDLLWLLVYFVASTTLFIGALLLVIWLIATSFWFVHSTLLLAGLSLCGALAILYWILGGGFFGTTDWIADKLV
jgi:hypothetical protein